MLARITGSPPASRMTPYGAHRRRTILMMLAFALACGATAPAAQTVQPLTRYERVAPSPDGIGRRYMGREIAQVMGWQGAAWLEREEREREERTDLLLTELQLEPGMTVADIGAGTGYIARRMARLVGPKGIVEAVDVQPQMIRIMKRLARKEGLSQIRPVLGAVDDVKLAPASIDVAIMVDVYHELEKPYEVLSSIVRALKPGGRVVFVEYRAEDPNVPIKPLHKMSVEQVQKEAAALPVEFERVAEPLPWQHIIVFRKR
jgi:ubiquinone/menaquinone biosynthesis C-methylase UbiE